jgi:flagellar P-ring protein precursor FlgI
VLLQTPRQGADGTVYAVAQGPISIGGFEIGQQAAAAGGNHPTVARVPGGAYIEREVSFQFAANGEVDVVLNRKDFTTASAVAQAVGLRFGEDFAHAVDAGLVRVRIPVSFKDDPVRFVAAIESVPVEVDGTTRIVINEKTGTIVIGSEVRVQPVVIAHGELRLRIQDGTGQTQRTDKAVVQLQAGVSMKELVDQLNALGVTSKDIIAIIQAIKASGAIQAEVEII